ncbi:hypothetical protein AB833_05470 [Chromatiales bacterium (ex Bugula neritina AB1)]|nr:hypothetical protein AB833_05470 [Chromatiales bacterium (ex Bugula neritina AB1)]
MPWRLILAGCIGMFAATATGSTRAPFLPDMAADLNVSLPAVANLFGVTAASWGISSYLAGFASDRLGRKVFLLGAPACIAFAMFAISRVPSYPVLVAIVVFAGVCCGAFTATILAEVSLRTHSSHHGRAFGYVMSGQSLTLLFGIPVAAWLGASVGWRGTHVVLSTLALFAFSCMVIGVRSTDSALYAGKLRSGGGIRLREAMTGPVIRLFISLIAERIAFGLAAFYYAAYLRVAYDLPIDKVALPLVVFALGNILGTFVGGQVADRFPYRRISFAVALAIAGCIAIPWFLWQPGVIITVTLGVLFAFFDAISRPPLLAALAEVPPDVRGVIMGMNSSIASIGWLIAALVGGWFYAGVGFSGFSPLMSAMCFVGALVVVPDSRVRQRFTR